jgi:hypothetical protein
MFLDRAASYFVRIRVPDVLMGSSKTSMNSQTSLAHRET